MVDSTRTSIVEFTPYAKRGEEKIIVDLLKDLMGMDNDAARSAVHGRKRLRCRKDQFADFIVFRYQQVKNNQIRNMRPLIIVLPENHFIDVSKNFPKEKRNV